MRREERFTAPLTEGAEDKKNAEEN